jgi:hypothetical protein
MIEELFEEGRMAAAEAEAAQRLHPEQKWFLLPKLAGRRRVLRDNVPPHQAVKEICRKRNALMHFNFDRLQLFPRKKMLSLFRQFMDAMEDMNVVLGYVKHPRSYVNNLKKL